MIAAAACASAASEQSGPYPFKSAMIKYRISGSLQEGTETLYIDDNGAKTCTERETTLDIMGQKRRESTIEIDDGNNLYSVNLIRKTGTKAPSYSKLAREMVQSMTAEQKKAMEKLGKEMVKGLTGKDEMKPEGTGKVLGKDCEIYSVMGVKSWQWNKLTLKTENPALGNMVQEAIELKVDIPIPPEKFKPPPGIGIVEIPGPHGG